MPKLRDTPLIVPDQPKRKTAKEINQVAEVRAEWGVDRNTLARMTGISERTIGEWERNGPKPGSNLRPIVELDRLYEALCKVVREEHILPWLKATNPAFDPLTPIEILERGQIDRIWRMIFEMEAGTAF
jgi:DNA-binding XRE family transcriptional regulator